MKTKRAWLNSEFRQIFVGLIALIPTLQSMKTMAVEHPGWIIDANKQFISHTPTQLIYGNGVIIGLVGSETGSDQIPLFLSEDGENWRNANNLPGADIPEATSNTTVAFGNGIFVMANASLYTSKHGIAWNQIPSTSQDGTDLSEYSFSKIEFQFGEFVAWDPSYGVILRSKDGVNWSLAQNLFRSISQVILHGPTQRWFIDVGSSIIAWNEASGWNTLIGRDGYDFELDLVGDNLVILEIQNGTQGNVFVANHISTDGDTWQISDSIVYNTFGNDQAYVETWPMGDDYVRFTYDISGTNVITTISESSDFVTWTDIISYNGAYPTAGTTIGENALGTSWISPNYVIRKQDGVWSTQQSFGQTEETELQYTAYSNGRADSPVYLGIKDNQVYQSLAGFEWEQVATLNVENLSYLEYIEANETFYAFAESTDGSFSVIQSFDGVEWSPFLANLAFEPQEITVGTDGNTILITGKFANEIRVSTDAGITWVENVEGITWHQPVNSAGDEFTSVYLMTEVAGDTFVLIWDDKAYQSTDGTHWTQTLDLQAGGTWFKYLDSFNGTFLATAVSWEYIGRFSVPRWADAEYKTELWTSTDGSEWNQVFDDEILNGEHGSYLYYYIFRSPSFDYWGYSRLGASGPYFYSYDEASFILDDETKLDVAPKDNGGLWIDSIRHSIFGKGRFMDQFRGVSGRNPKTGDLLLSTLQTTFVGFGNFETDGTGRKHTGWFGALNDANYPMIDHEVFGEVKFSIDDTDTITLSSDQFGIAQTTRAHPELVENLIDGKTYHVDLSGNSTTPFEDVSTSQSASSMLAENLSALDWMTRIDEIQETIVTYARNTIIASQEARTIDAVDEWLLLNKEMELFEAVEQTLRAKFDPLESELSNRLSTRKASAQEVYNMAKERILQ